MTQVTYHPPGAPLSSPIVDSVRETMIRRNDVRRVWWIENGPACDMPSLHVGRTVIGRLRDGGA